MKIYTTVRMPSLDGVKDVIPMAHFDMRNEDAFGEGHKLGLEMAKRAPGERSVLVKDFGEGPSMHPRRHLITSRELGESIDKRYGPMGLDVLRSLPAFPVMATEYLVKMHRHEPAYGPSLLGWLTEARVGYLAAGGPEMDLLCTEFEDNVGMWGGRRGWDVELMPLLAWHPATCVELVDGATLSAHRERGSLESIDSTQFKPNTPGGMVMAKRLNCYSAVFVAECLAESIRLTGWSEIAKRKCNYTSWQQYLPVRKGKPMWTRADAKMVLANGYDQVSHAVTHSGWVSGPDHYLHDVWTKVDLPAWEKRRRSCLAPRLEWAGPPRWGGDHLPHGKGDEARDTWVLFWGKPVAKELVLWSNGELATGDTDPAGKLDGGDIEAVKRLARM